MYRNEGCDEACRALLMVCGVVNKDVFVLVSVSLNDEACFEHRVVSFPWLFLLSFFPRF